MPVTGEFVGRHLLFFRGHGQGLAPPTVAPKFSIVTPSLNTARFLAEAIESVLSQAGAFAIEYLVLDGGSTDGSVPIIQRYATEVASGAWPVRCAGLTMEWVSQPDRGQSAAINQGLRRATGDVVAWINSDDAYAPGAFACIAEEFARHPEADFVYGDGDVIDAAGGLQWRWLSRPYNFRVLTSYHFLWNDFTNYIMQQSTFWRRSALDRIGYLDESFHYAMDVEYWIRAGARGLRLHHVPRPLARFRLIAGTKSLSSATVFWEDYLEIFRRHRGAGRLARFFAFYYYNLGRQLDFELARLLEAKPAILRRWAALPDEGRRSLGREADRGFQLACFLLAHDLSRRGCSDDAARLVRQGITGGVAAVCHPFAWPYLAQRLLGPRLYPPVERRARELIRRIRAYRYDYRYLERPAG